MVVEVVQEGEDGRGLPRPPSARVVVGGSQTPERLVVTTPQPP